MAVRKNSEGPSVLQLQRWDPSQVQLNLSEFREAFISPTRELLVLLSHHCEALLLPLRRGDSSLIGYETCKYKSRVDLNSVTDLDLTMPSRSDSLENIASTSETVTRVSNNEFSIDGSISPSNSYRFVCDVKSLAWGLCVDTYNQHKEALFRELLFVAGNHGVTIHGFLQSGKKEKVVRSSFNGEHGQGRWVEWGTSIAVFDNEEVSGEATDVSRSDGAGQSPYCSRDESLSGSKRSLSPKKWLQSFLTAVETKRSDGLIWTQFPDESVFPSSATVVSFNISFDESLFLGLCCARDSVLNQEKSIVGTAEESYKISETRRYKCSKVFSSESYNVVGFVLTSTHAVADNNSGESDENWSKSILIARIDRRGIQWLCNVKLDKVNMSLKAEWVDFQFSGNFLICLNNFGLIHFYDAMTGAHVLHLDVLRMHAVEPGQRFQEVEKSLSQPQNNASEQKLDVASKVGFQTRSAHQKISFRRLIVASCSSLLAVVDDCGIVYVVCMSDHLAHKYSSFENLQPQYPRLGLLAPWEAGSYDISSQKVFSCLSGHQKASTRYKTSAIVDDCGNLELFSAANWCVNRLVSGDDLNGFSVMSQNDVQSSTHPTCARCIRKYFLPISRAGWEDTICFSPLGITRLIKPDNTREKRSCHIVYMSLHVESNLCDDRCLSSAYGTFDARRKERAMAGEAVDEEAVGCVFQGYLYLVTGTGLSVVLPTVSVPSDFHPIEFIGYPCQETQNMLHKSLRRNGTELWSPWKVVILDRILLHEGPKEADFLCLENGWDLKVPRLRRLQLAVAYLKFEEIEGALESLAAVDMAEEAVLRLIFAAVYLMVHIGGNDSDVSAVSRLLAVATCFATKMIREYATANLKKNASAMQSIGGMVPLLPYKECEAVLNLTRLQEMAHYLEIIRSLQCRLAVKFNRLGRGAVDDWKVHDLEDNRTLSLDDSQLSVITADTSSNLRESPVPGKEFGDNHTEKLALVPVELLGSEDDLNLELKDGVSSLVPSGILTRRSFSIENPKEMIARWEIDNLDLKNVVRDALLSGRLPLAVLQLHLHRLKSSVNDKKQSDTFAEVRDVGRMIAYELFLKGETGLAVETLQRLGEDVEKCLKELLFGTVSRPLRKQIMEEMKKCGYLRSYELAILDRLLLIERIYPSSNFRRTYLSRKQEVMGVPLIVDAPEENSLCLLHPYLFRNVAINCGDIDGVVLGSWRNANVSYAGSELDEDCSHAGYWTAAAVWFNAWDQKTIDRILLDHPFLMGVHVSWESQIEYHICHSDWEEVSKLLCMIPSSLLSEQKLQISLDGLQPVSFSGCNMHFPDYGGYMCSSLELDGVCIEIPNTTILCFPANIICSTWLRMLLDKELAKKFVFLKEYWDSTSEIISVMARSGFIVGEKEVCSQVESTHLDLTNVGKFHPDTVQAIHKLVIHFCTQYNLPYFLDFYLDHHALATDGYSLSALQDAAGDSDWAKWLLFSRVKGHEYDASFYNARGIMAPNIFSEGSLPVSETNEIICTVDDIAEGGWLKAALATLMFAPLPLDSCLNSGSVNRRCSFSAQCTLENLQPALQQFPTLWHILLAACLGQDTTSSLWGAKVRNVNSNSALSIYLNWRDNIFFSSGRDTSLLQMLPCWFPKVLWRLIQLFVQGPLVWQSVAGLTSDEIHLQREIDLLMNNHEYFEISAVSWEAAIHKQIEQELYASSAEGVGLGLEENLHRGRALAAFNHLLGYRVQQLKTGSTDRGESSASIRGQPNVQSDVQTLLQPLTQSEETLLSLVIPLAIADYRNSVLVASCAFLLELCGISAGMLRVDVAALRRIYSFYDSTQSIEQQNRPLPKGAFSAVSHGTGSIADSLAQSLADYYVYQEHGRINKKGQQTVVTVKQNTAPLMLVLQHLEKASLPVLSDGKTCGSWLSSGDGDGNDLRSQQKAAGHRWSLVTVFCRMHQIPLSVKYLALLARDDDWVGFLSEAQVGGYPFDMVIQTAGKEFRDARLKTHVLTVLRTMLSRKKTGMSSGLESPETQNRTSSDHDIGMPVELFGILALCEKKKHPGKTLLLKAKELRWSLLAVMASCFPDVSPLACLTVWLEITEARETSVIREQDIASYITNRVGAAVEATNTLPADDKIPTFHYNRKSPKRRRLVDPTSMDFSNGTIIDIASTTSRIFDKAINEMEPEKDFKTSNESHDWPVSLSQMVAVLCERHQFLPLLRAFEMFLPSCSLLPFVRALQAFSQMRLSEASAHLGSFSARIKEEPFLSLLNFGRAGLTGASWISSTAIKATDAILSTCPSPYEKRCLLNLLAAADFGDGGSTATYYRRHYWKINLAEAALRKEEDLQLGNEMLDDASLLMALEKNGHWEQARNWARQLEASGGPWKSVVHHVTETQAESMVVEWKEFLWDEREERVALWAHCHTLFIRYSFPALQAGLFFLKHAEAVEQDLPPSELHELLLLSLQWLSGTITQSHPVCPLHLLREIETRVWLLAVESEAQLKRERGFSLSISKEDQLPSNSSSTIDRTANVIASMDSHMNAMKIRLPGKGDVKENNWDAGVSAATLSTKSKRRAKALGSTRRTVAEVVDKGTDLEDVSTSIFRHDAQDENLRIEAFFSRWEERVGPAELERAVLSLLEFGQITAAKQLQHKFSDGNVPFEFQIVDTVLKLADLSTPPCKIPVSVLDEDVRSVLQSYKILTGDHFIEPLQVLESASGMFTEGGGYGLCKRIIAVVKAANVLGISFSEAFEKQPTELLQLLSLKAQDSFEETRLLVQTHSMPATSIAQILAESFLKGLLAAHRGGYIDSQREEGPAPLLWRFSDFLKWADLCPSEPEVGHALMRLVVTGQGLPHVCEVELLILSHHFYQSSACLDGVDVLVALAATRVEAYASEGDFSCLARLITGVGNFHALSFILGILIENGQLELLLQKFSAAAEADAGAAKAVRGFRMAVLTALKHFNPNDLDAFATVYNHFDMKHETASLLESRAEQSYWQWFLRYDRDQNEDLLEAMRYYIEAAEVHSSIDAGRKTRAACAQASLVSLQIRMPDIQWLNLSDTNARRLLVEQSHFQEALIVAEAYNLNQPTEWALVLWNQMHKPELLEEFVSEFVGVLPLHPSMLNELARFYKSEMAARGDQSQFSVWLSGGGFPAEWAKYMGRSFRCLLKRTRDLRLRLQLANVATGFVDVVDVCNKLLDKVPENAGPLVLRKGHGGAYLPLM